MKKQILAPSILALFVASAAHAGATFDTEAGSLYLGGDVEFDYTSETDANVKSTGRLLLDIHGEHVLENGNFAAFKVNPVFGQQGSADATDDVYFQFGVKGDWDLKLGHFEAADLSSAGQDTYVAEAANSASMYRAKDARGRTSAGNNDTQATFTKAMGDAAFELTVQATKDNDTDGNNVVLRPVYKYAADSVSFAVGAEVPVHGEDSDVTGYDSTDWFGFGATTTIQATDDLSVTVRAAYKNDETDATEDVDAMTAGLGLGYGNFYAAVLYGQDEISQTNGSSETIEQTQVYTSYKIPAVMDIDNFDVYLGAGVAFAENNEDDVVGGRIRLKYIF